MKIIEEKKVKIEIGSASPMLVVQK